MIKRAIWPSSPTRSGMPALILYARNAAMIKVRCSYRFRHPARAAQASPLRHALELGTAAGCRDHAVHAGDPPQQLARYLAWGWNSDRLATAPFSDPVPRIIAYLWRGSRHCSAGSQPRRRGIVGCPILIGQVSATLAPSRGIGMPMAGLADAGAAARPPR